MLTREEMFKQLMQETEDKMKEVLEEQATKVVCEYLPYVESDVERNVELRAWEIVQQVISGKGEVLSRIDVLQQAGAGQLMREAIYQQYEYELQTQQVKDLEDKIVRLKEQLNYCYNAM